jgi:GTP-binding protein
MSALIGIACYLTRFDSLRLRRVYILFDPRTGLNKYDLAMLQFLDAHCHASSSSSTLRFTVQAVLTKMDLIPRGKIQAATDKMRMEITGACPTCLPPIITTVRTVPRFGVEEMRESIVEACGIGEIAV